MNTKFSKIKKQLLLAGLFMLTLSVGTVFCPTSAVAQCTPPAAPTAGTPQTFCSSANSTISNLNATVPLGCTLQWYSVSSGGAILDPGAILVNGATYYAESFDPSTVCTSITRTAVLVNFISPPVVTANPNQTFCDGAVVANLSATVFGPGMINWYSTPSGGLALFFFANLTNGTTYYAESSFNGCASVPRVAVFVTLLTRPAPSFLSSVTNTCAGTAGNVYTTEPGKSNYTWSVSSGGTITSGGGSTDNSVTVTWNTAGSQTVSVNYTDVFCNAASPTVLNVNVDSSPVGGSISSSATVCAGTNSTLLTLTGNTGSILKWQSSTDNWTTPIDIVNTSSTFTATNLNSTTKFRAVLQNGSCFSNSADATITVDPPSIGGTVASSTSVCTAVNSTVLTLSGYTGTITKWQYDDGAGWTDIANVTTSLTATNLTKTTSYRAEVVNGTCPPAFSAPATITVDPPTVAGAVAPNASVCTGINSTVLTLGGHTGTVTRWQYDEGTGWIDIANVTTVYTAVNLTKTTSFRAEVVNGTCPPAFSSPAAVTVDPPTVAGAVAPSISVCSGINSTVLTLSSQTGTVTRWQYDEGTGWIDIANITTSYTAVNLIKTTSFRAEVANGTCPPAFSASATITVDPPTVAGTVASSTTVCSGTNNTVLTLSGHTGTVTKWQYDEGTGWIDIVNVTTSQTATNLTKTTSYRAEVTNGVCPPAYSATATITIDPPSLGGAVAGSTIVCSGTNSTVLTLSGHTGTVTKWQYDEGAGWIDLANVTTSQTATNLTKTTSYRAQVTNGTCPPDYSAPATITVDPPSIGGTVASSTSVCTAVNSTVLTLSGHTGTVTKWQYDDGAGWTDIANVTTSFTATNLLITTSYRAQVTNGSCSSSYSSTATITVNSPSVGGTVASSTTVCSGTNSTVLSLSGHTGTVTKWQYDDGAGWIDIANVTTSLTATNLTKTTSYRAQVTNGACPPAFSAAATITLDPPSVGGTVAGSAIVCSGTNSTVLTLSGHTGTVTKWQYDDGAGWIDIANVTTSQTAANLAKTTSYRAQVTNGACPPIFSSTATITVNPISVGGSIAGSASVCNCSNSTALTLSGHTGSIIRWQSSTDNWVTSNDISNTTNSLTATNLIITTSYRAIVTSGICPSAISGTATITVNSCNAAPIITSNGGGATGVIDMPENTTVLTVVTATDADVPAQTLTYSISGGADQSLFAINSSTGALRFNSAPDYESPSDAGSNNLYNVQVMVSDNCTFSLNDLQDLAITVTNFNDVPFANADNYEVTENQKLDGNVLSNDSDEDGNNLSVSIVPVQAPLHGTLVLSTNGDFTYQPVIDFIGNDSFTYQVCDNGNPVFCSVATASITVVKDDNCEVFVPNSFSPNGDGIHDYFKIRCLYNYENPIIEIYNRWGNLVYKKDHYGNLDFWGTDADAFWNGNSDQKGNLGSKELTVGTYYYILKLNKGEVLTGFIFLNR